jgi:YfiH family protein
VIRLFEQPARPTILRSDRLAECGIPHAFSTRHGGVSEPPFDSLNLGNPSADTALLDADVHIAENYRRFQQAIGCGKHQRVWVHQVHGRDCVRAGSGNGHEKADALVSDDPGLLLSVRTADCVAILLARTDGHRVAVVHAGWRGLVAGVIGHAVSRFGVPPSDLIAAIGPAISATHFEVGEEVAAAFDDAHVVRRPGGKPHVDLPATAAWQLRVAGLDESRIDRGDWCTYRDRDLFFSHRRDHGRTGRMAAVIAALPAKT